MANSSVHPAELIPILVPGTTVPPASALDMLGTEELLPWAFPSCWLFPSCLPLHHRELMEKGKSPIDQITTHATHFGGGVVYFFIFIFSYCLSFPLAASPCFLLMEKTKSSQPKCLNSP